MEISRTHSYWGKVISLPNFSLDHHVYNHLILRVVDIVLLYSKPFHPTSNHNQKQCKGTLHDDQCHLLPHLPSCEVIYQHPEHLLLALQ